MRGADVRRAHRDRVAARVAQRSSPGDWRRPARAAPRRRGPAADRHRSTATRRRRRRARSLERRVDDLLDRAPSRLRLGGIRLEAREVEQVVDQARQPRGLDGDAREQLDRAPSRDSPSAASASRAMRIAVSGERRSCETARSSAVFSTSDRRSAAGLDDLAEQLVALQRRGKQGLERRDDAVPNSDERALCKPGRHDQRPDLALPIAQRERDVAVVGLDGLELDRRRGQPEGFGYAMGDRRERVVAAVAAQQQPRHLRGEVGFLAPVPGLRRLPPGPRCERADHDRCDEEHRQRDPVLAIADREAPGRREVKEVVGHRARECRGDPEPGAPECRHEQHCDEVDDAQRLDRRDALQRIDERGRERNGQRGNRDAKRCRRGPDAALPEGHDLRVSRRADCPRAAPRRA